MFYFGKIILSTATYPVTNSNCERIDLLCFLTKLDSNQCPTVYNSKDDHGGIKEAA